MSVSGEELWDFPGERWECITRARGVTIGGGGPKMPKCELLDLYRL